MAAESKANPSGPAGSPGTRTVLLFLLFGSLFAAFLSVSSLELLRTGRNDFMGFYSTGKLAFTGDLYQPDRHYAIQTEATGYHGKAWICVRFPYLALFFAPFATLDYLAAWRLYLACSIAAGIAFVLLWPDNRKLWIATSAIAALPLTASILNGQDVVFLLLSLALGFRFLDRQQPFAAGVVFSLLAAKPHLFVFMPVVMLFYRQWRLLGGFLSGGAILAAASFLVAGPSWIPEFLTVLRLPALHQRNQMPNLHVLFDAGINPYLISAAAAPLLIFALGKLSRQASLSLSLAAAIPAGILIAPHVYLADLALMLPLVLLSWQQFPHPLNRTLAAWYLLPIGPICLVFGYPWVVSAPILLLAILAALVLTRSSFRPNP